MSEQVSTDNTGNTYIFQMQANCGSILINHNGDLHEIEQVPPTNPGDAPLVIFRPRSNSLTSITSSGVTLNQGSSTGGALQNEPNVSVANHQAEDDERRIEDSPQPWYNNLNYNYAQTGTIAPESGSAAQFIQEDDDDDIEIVKVVEPIEFLINALKDLMPTLHNLMRTTHLNFGPAHSLLSQILGKCLGANLSHLSQTSVVNHISGLDSIEAKDSLKGSEELVQRAIQCIRQLVPGIGSEVLVKREEVVERKPVLPSRAEELPAPSLALAPGPSPSPGPAPTPGPAPAQAWQSSAEMAPTWFPGARTVPYPSEGPSPAFGTVPAVAEPVRVSGAGIASYPFERPGPSFGTGSAVAAQDTVSFPGAGTAPPSFEGQGPAFGAPVGARVQFSTTMELAELKPNSFDKSAYVDLQTDDVVEKVIHGLTVLQQKLSTFSAHPKLKKSIHYLWVLLKRPVPSESIKNIGLLRNTIMLICAKEEAVAGSEAILLLMKWIAFRINRLLTGSRKRKSDTTAVEMRRSLEGGEGRN